MAGKRRRLLVAILVCGTLVAACLYALRARPVPVDVARVARGALQVTVDDEGRTRVRDRYLVSAPVSGELRRLAWRAGDAVLEGAVLAAILPALPAPLDQRLHAEQSARVESAAAGVTQAQAELERAAVAVELARDRHRRVRELAGREPPAVTAEDIERAFLEERQRLAERDAAAAALRVAEFALAQARASLDWQEYAGTVAPPALEVKSPIEGRVLLVLRQSAGPVAAGEPLIELADPRALEVVVDLLSSDAVRVHPGARARLERWGGPRALEAVVRTVEPLGVTRVSALGIEEQRVDVILDLVPAEELARLGDGFRVEARIVVWENDAVLKTPSSALFRHQGGWAVFRLIDERAERVTVSIGQDNGTEAEVLAGLGEGDTVILYPGDRIDDGVRVEVSPEGS